MECWQGQQHTVFVEAGAAAIFLLNSLYKTHEAGEDNSTGEQGDTLSTEEMLSLHPLACQRMEGGSESWQKSRRCRLESPYYFVLIIILFPLVPAPEKGL